MSEKLKKHAILISSILTVLIALFIAMTSEHYPDVFIDYVSLIIVFIFAGIFFVLDNLDEWSQR